VAISRDVTAWAQPIGSAFLSGTLPVPGGYYYTVVFYGTSAAAEMALLERRLDQVAPAGSALLRFYNATSLSGALDVYLHSTDSTPIVTGLPADSSSTFVTIAAQSSTLIITAAGSKVPLATLDAPLNERAVLTMFITGDSESELVVYALNAGNIEEHVLPQLQPREGTGAVPTLRFVNLVPQLDARHLDAYLDGTLAADSIAYRSASGILPNVAEGERRVQFVPAGQSPVDSVYGAAVQLERDTAYTMILTQFSGGRIISMTIGRSLSLPPLAPGTVAIRFANANDFRRDIQIAIAGADTATFSEQRFLQVSEWRVINAGDLTLQAFVPGIAAPIFQGTYTAASGECLTLIGLGNADTYIVDVLRETLPGAQEPMESFGEQQTSVRDELIALGRELGLRAVPNPLVRSGRIAFDLRAGAISRLELFDALGRSVAILEDGWRGAGPQNIELDATGLESGTYTVLLTSGSRRAAARIVVAE
jgi:hypothetical protein